MRPVTVIRSITADEMQSDTAYCEFKNLALELSQITGAEVKLVIEFEGKPQMFFEASGQEVSIGLPDEHVQEIRS